MKSVYEKEDDFEKWSEFVIKAVFDQLSDREMEFAYERSRDCEKFSACVM